MTITPEQMQAIKARRAAYTPATWGHVYAVEDIDTLIAEVERLTAALVEKPAPVCNYVQPSMIDEYEGSPLFSMTQEN
jgi:hypothetical protein